MSPVVFRPRPLAPPDPPPAPAPADWLWDGFLARGDVAVLGGGWGAGKTTLLAGLLHALGTGGALLGRGCRGGAAAVVVSREPDAHWHRRQQVIPAGARAGLLARPFLARPTPDGWAALARDMDARRAAGGLDLLAVDDLWAFLPGWEDDPAAPHAFFAPLRRLADAGAAVLVLAHRPRRAPDAAGGAVLPGYVDVVLGLCPVGRGPAPGRRRLTVRSRRGDAEVVYEWVPGTAEFRVVPDDPEARFRAHWPALRARLAARPGPATQKELLAAWPPADRPDGRVLYDRLRRAAAAGLVGRTGRGTKADPYRFALPGPADPPDPGPVLPPGW